MKEHSTLIEGIIQSFNAQLFESNNWVKSYSFRSISKILNQINQSMNVHSFTTTMPNVTLISSLINSVPKRAFSSTYAVLGLDHVLNTLLPNIPKVSTPLLATGAAQLGQLI